MSIFAKIKSSKKAAPQQTEKTTTEELSQQKQEDQKVARVPYRHVPTHAAVDALSGAPSSWKNEDRTKIREHHQRRDQMTISRTHSSLSALPTPSMNIESFSGIPSLPRPASYDNPTWNNRMGDMSILTEKLQMRPQSIRSKSATSHLNHGIDSTIGRSPLSSHLQSEATSPVASSGNSMKTSSSSASIASDDLEIASSVPRRLRPRRSFRPEPVVFEGHDAFSRLHTSTTRKLGEAPIMTATQVQLPKPAPVLVAPESKQKKTRWTLMGRHNGSSITA
ncbi:hypothetical protein NHQ30_006105 [Ciborinia camelliae]|nr:hypothetical protein NHQ30_006105 [Ciborinia camelliae]